MDQLVAQRADHRQLLADRNRLAYSGAGQRGRATIHPFGSPGKAVYGYNVKLIDEATGEELTTPNQKGVVAVEGPLPPGCMQTVGVMMIALSHVLEEHSGPLGL